jgi:hypothetical protein
MMTKMTDFKVGDIVSLAPGKWKIADKIVGTEYGDETLYKLIDSEGSVIWVVNKAIKTSE